MRHPSILLAATLLAACFGVAADLGALETESFRFTDRLLSISGPGAPDVYDGAVIFTASGRHRAGVAFAHEGYGKVHWFKKLVSPRTAERHDDVLVYVFEYPHGMTELNYRLIVDGLWTSDPWNPPARMDGGTGLSYSIVRLPVSHEEPIVSEKDNDRLNFSYNTAPGESVTVAGSFNSWDPFMYEMKEESPGRYSLSIPLPPGTYRYAFFVRGERLLDPRNPRKVYTPDGSTASEIDVGLAVALHGKEPAKKAPVAKPKSSGH